MDASSTTAATPDLNDLIDELFEERPDSPAACASLCLRVLEHPQASTLDEQLRADVLDMRASALHRAGDLQGALEVTRERNAGEWNATPDGRSDEAMLLVELGDIEAGTALYETLWHEAVAADDSPWWLAYNAGITWEQQAAHELAVDWLGRSMRAALDADDPDRLVADASRSRRAALEALGRERDDLEQEASPLVAADLARRANQAMHAEQHAERVEAFIAALTDPRVEGPEDLTERSGFASTLRDEGFGVTMPFRPDSDPEPVQRELLLLQLGAELDRDAMPRFVAHVTDADADAWARAHDVPAGSTRARARCAAEIARRGDAIAWPPQRNEPCWCASGRKYKKCCGTVRLTEPNHEEARHDVLIARRDALRNRHDQLIGLVDEMRIAQRDIAVADSDLTVDATPIERAMAELDAFASEDPAGHDAREFDDFVGMTIYGDLLDLAAAQPRSASVEQLAEVLTPMLEHAVVTADAHRADILRLAFCEALGMSERPRAALRLGDATVAAMREQGVEPRAATRALLADNYLSLGDINRAEAVWNDLVRRHPDDAAHVMEIAGDLLEEDYPRDAVAWLQRQLRELLDQQPPPKVQLQRALQRLDRICQQEDVQPDLALRERAAAAAR